MTNQILLPKTNWNGLISALITKKLAADFTFVDDDLQILAQLGYVSEMGELTPLGTEVCRLEYVTRDSAAAYDIHQRAVASLPATQVVLQSLWGVENIDTNQVKNALLFFGVNAETVSKRIVNFLEILNRQNIVIFNRRNKSVVLLIAPIKTTTREVPDHVYVDSSRPFANDFYIREILRETRGKVMWLDKYFQKEGLEWLWREADANNIHSIAIVSSANEGGVDKVALDDYKRLRKELATKGITLEWRVLARSESHTFHDRWILDDAGLCYNVPSINSIKSGQKSELHKSPNGNEVKKIFDKYFNAAKHIV